MDETETKGHKGLTKVTPTDSDGIETFSDSTVSSPQHSSSLNNHDRHTNTHRCGHMKGHMELIPLRS